MYAVLGFRLFDARFLLYFMVFIVEKFCKEVVLNFYGFSFGSIFNVITLCLLHVCSLHSLGGEQKEKMAQHIVSNLYVLKKKKK